MKQFLACAILGLLLTSCGTVQPTPTPTVLPTLAPASTSTPIPTATNTSVPTATPTATIAPSATPFPTRTATATPVIQYVTLGSPFAKDCGDGTPRIWSDSSFRGAWDQSQAGPKGHFDLFPPAGCLVNDITGEVLAPVSGKLVAENNREVYRLYFDDGTFPAGILEALRYAGVEPDLASVSNTYLNLGHISPLPGIVNSRVNKGQSIADIVQEAGHWKIAYKINFTYRGKLFDYGPNMFVNDTPMVCHPDFYPGRLGDSVCKPFANPLRSYPEN